MCGIICSKSWECTLKGGDLVLDANGNVCEFDGYKIPKQMPESPERENLHEEAVKEGRKLIEDMKKKYGF